MSIQTVCQPASQKRAVQADESKHDSSVMACGKAQCRRHRLRFSLLGLLAFVILVNAVSLLYLHWEPWTLERVIPFDAFVGQGAAFTKDGRTLLLFKYSGTEVYSLEEKRLLDGSQRQRVIDASENDPTLWTESQNDNMDLEITSRASGRILYTVKSCPPWFRAGNSWISPDGNRVLSVSEGGWNYLWNLRDGSCTRLKDEQQWGSPTAIAGEIPRHCWAADGETFLAYGYQVQIVHSDSLETVQSFPKPLQGVESAALSKDGHRMAESIAGQAIEIWDLPAHALRHRLTNPLGKIVHLYFSNDGERLFALDFDDQYAIWDVNTGTCLGHWKTPNPNESRLDVSPNLDRIVLSHDGFKISILDAYGALLAVAEANPDLYESYSMQVNPFVAANYSSPAIISEDSNHILTWRQDTAVLWRRNRPEPWWGIAVLPGSWIALASASVLLWNALRRKGKQPKVAVLKPLPCRK